MSMAIKSADLPASRLPVTDLVRGRAVERGLDSLAADSAVGSPLNFASKAAD